jgi:hypothetical protein
VLNFVKGGLNSVRRQWKWVTKDKINIDSVTYFEAKLEGVYPKLTLFTVATSVTF